MTIYEDIAVYTLNISIIIYLKKIYGVILAMGVFINNRFSAFCCYE